MIYPVDLRDKAVVVVNEYTTSLTGHVNVTFLWHGIDQGTFGQNIVGKDIKGVVHKVGRPGISMAGGVFVEPNLGAKRHYVIISEANYRAMHNYALARAEKTATSPTKYYLAEDNCADFVYQVFAVADLPPLSKLISLYLEDGRPPVAIYASRQMPLYFGLAVIDSTKRAMSRPH